MELLSIIVKIAGYFGFCFAVMKMQGKKSLTAESMIWIGFFYILFLGSV